MSTPAEQLQLKPDLPALGIHEGMSFEDYKRAPGMNKHGLDNIHKSPATYLFERRYPRPSTPAMMFGSALHCLVLEPEEFPKIYIQDKFSGSYSKEAKAWRKEMEKAGKLTISTKADETKGPWGVSDWDQLHLMRDSVMANPFAEAMINTARVELTLFWIDQDTKRLCKGRLDGYSEGHFLMFDLKTANDASCGGFQRAVHEYRYDVQDAWYQDGARECGLRSDGFVFLCVEKDPPYLTACYTITPEWRRQGRAKYRQDMDTYQRCLKADEWPGYEPMRDLDMPGFAKYNRIS